MKDWSYEEASKNAEHLKAIGQDEIYLNCGVLPWHLVTGCEPGGSHRLDISTSVWFHAKDEKTGLRFRWTFDIEPREANGRGIYMIDTVGCQEVLKKLNGDPLVEFRKYLAACAESVTKQAQEYQKAADKQNADAAILRDLIRKR